MFNFLRIINYLVKLYYYMFPSKLATFLFIAVVSLLTCSINSSVQVYLFRIYHVKTEVNILPMKMQIILAPKNYIS
jgi:hypothetical protein